VRGAWAVLVLAGAGGATLATRSGGGTGAGLPAVPFQVASLARPGAPAGERRAVLYLSDSCRWCSAEVAAWERALAETPGSEPPTVVFSPGSDPASLGGLPPRLRAGAFHDRTGALGRELGVRAVPFLALVDGGGTAHRVQAGLTPPDTLRRILGQVPRAPAGRGNP